MEMSVNTNDANFTTGDAFFSVEGLNNKDKKVLFLMIAELIRREAELFLKTFGKIGVVTESDSVCNFGDGAGIFFEKFFCTL